MVDGTRPDNAEKSFDERVNRETRPPNGQRLILHSLRFVEVIKLEEYDKLEEGLNRLYDETLDYGNVLSIPSEQERYRNFIAKSREAFLSKRWANLQGFVSKSFAESHKSGIITRPVRELPEGVESLSFFLCQIFPSVMVVIVRVQYSTPISDSLNTIFTKNYSERIEKREHRTLHTPLEVVKAEKIQDFIAGLQISSESFVSRYFSGVFLSQKGAGILNKCPSIKLFSLQDIPFTPAETLIAWIKEHGHFIDVLGYGAVPSWIYQFDNEYLLLRRRSIQRKEKPMYLSLLSSESLFKTPEAQKGFETAISALEHKHEIAFDNLMPLIAFNHLLLFHSNRLIAHRNKLAEYKIDTKRDLGSLKKQYDSMYDAKIAIDNDYFDFVRLRQELEDITLPQAEQWLYRDTAEFEYIENPQGLPHYAKELVSYISFLGSTIDKEYTLLNKRYSGLFESISAHSNFILAESNTRYQRWLSYLTWALVGLTVVMLAAVIIQIFLIINSG